MGKTGTFRDRSHPCQRKKFSSGQFDDRTPAIFRHDRDTSLTWSQSRRLYLATGKRRLVTFNLFLASYY